MNAELLAIVEQIERDKGVKKEILIQAIEAALVSAVRKVMHIDKEQDNIRVELNRATGGIKAFEGDKEITSADFGRIAAQTAKQVIIQKIREAEKEVIYTEFQARVGELVSGGVYRFEKGNIIVDLGKTEGFVPRSEQSPAEKFNQGERIRAYVLDVRKETKGPQIVLSRTNPNLVKKLFELEVPEIYEGIVEIRAIAREAGERTKIAVRSKDEKVDCLGACVGMRGQRVKGIVTELHGERIDIVRFSEDAVQYIGAALSPAKISEIRLDKESKKALVIVDDDQLSLAIGRKGQNVRLACALTGWELDIRTKTQMAEALLGPGRPKEERQEKPQKPAAKPSAAVSELSGVGAKTVELLADAGFDTLEKIAQSDIETLTQVKGIGEKKAAALIEQAQGLTGQKKSKGKK